MTRVMCRCWDSSGSSICRVAGLCLPIVGQYEEQKDKLGFSRSLAIEEKEEERVG
jgi:hypothetical protein